ncbi:hypothetical protein CY34DRAFT_723105 [Suillus luteus UH-Slu-Lm8-n1]|uniref:Unplaced genomic scaffold CY34scaffold_866, whole genome shotgun sequence n=1 Tax=Suillus luteus UH-Slu-Lm8-n1 TaxID=930992 RepID=A0A0D0AMF4_9AGAM|nr:hypothetical protein CY34DRAFT_723105 [Suillus luteus UH-Slu-Lm8-n1]
MKKIAKGIKKLSKPFKRSRNRIPGSQPENVDPQDASSGQEGGDTFHLHPSHDKENRTIPEISNDSMNQGPSEEVPVAPSGDAQSAGAALQGAHDGVQSMKSLGKRATSAASAGVNAPANLDAVDNFETTYIQPLKIADAVLDTITGVRAIIADRK